MSKRKRVTNPNQFSISFDDSSTPAQPEDAGKRAQLESTLRMLGSSIQSHHRAADRGYNSEEHYGKAAELYPRYVATHNELNPDNPISVADIHGMLD